MSALGLMRRAVVVVADRADDVLDELLYRPAVVKATEWLPRWWQCDLARLSRRLDERWQVGWWDQESIVPGSLCAACGRRASIHVYGGVDPDDEDPPTDLLARTPVEVCGWCRLDGQISTQDDLQRALAAARSRSVSWRWRVG